MKIRIASGMVAVLVSTGAVAQQIMVVNMVPATNSGETNQDSEPDLTVNPNNPNEVVATAFTPNPTGATATAPVYISQDGGTTWTLNNIVPSANGSTGDITVALSRNNVLYAGILRGGAGLDMRILRSSTYTAAGTMTELMARTQEDQPYTRAHSPLGGAFADNDHLYVGHNDQNVLPRSASFEQSLNVRTAAPPAGLAAVRLERRTPFNQDGPPIRPAVHPNGTVYAVYTQRTASVGAVRTGNIVVVRDDDWGQGATPFGDLIDPGDTIAGSIVANGVSWVWNTGAAMGQERLGDKAAIAVDPADSQIVYVAWTDRPGTTGNTATVHVRNSVDGGQTWSADLRTINDAINPALAINARSDVGLAFQQLTGTGATQRWETHFQQLNSGAMAWTDFTLATTLASAPVRVFGPYLGDYIGLAAVGKDFYGVFSASNLPDNANFPNNVTYQRPANFTTNTLTDALGAAVAVSIDPFFFRVSNLTANEDFYARDWTDSAILNDIGLEPSTRPVFYATSDVWNRRSNASGGFDASDRPISEDPQGSPSMGPAFDNFAFARVHRKTAGVAKTVSLRFLKSEFGTGSNFVAAGTDPDPTLAFAAADPVQTMSSGYRWNLNTTSSTHTCIAVELSTPQDPVAAPGLLGRAPGWPNTDLIVINDNNKAQRNMGVYPDGSESGSISYWAIIHNAATRFRDMTLAVQWDARRPQAEGRARVTIVGGGKNENQFKSGRISLLNMAPGENRWVRIDIPSTAGRKLGERAAASISEMAGDLPVNGFTIAAERQPIEIAAAALLKLMSANAQRAAAILNEPFAPPNADQWRNIEKTDARTFVEAVRGAATFYAKLIGVALKRVDGDPFGLKARLGQLGSALKSGNPRQLFSAQANLDHALDAFLTFLQLRSGDVADAAQNMRWQADLFLGSARLQKLSGAQGLIDLSNEFDLGYATGRLTTKDYPGYVTKTAVGLRRALELATDRDGKLLPYIDELSSKTVEPNRAQWLHREILLKLESLRDK